MTAEKTSDLWDRKRLAWDRRNHPLRQDRKGLSILVHRPSMSIVNFHG